MRYLLGAKRRRVYRWFVLRRSRTIDVLPRAGPLGTSNDRRAIGNGRPGASIGAVSAFGRSSLRGCGRGRRLRLGRAAAVLTGWRSPIQTRRLRRAWRRRAMAANDGEDF